MTQLEDQLRTLRGLEPRAPADMAALRRRVGRRRSRRVAVGAAASLVIALGAIAAWPSDNDSTRVQVVDHPVASPSTSSPSNTAAFPSTSLPPLDEDVDLPAPTAQPPAQFIAVTGDGRLVVVETATGRELRQLTASGDPTAEPSEEGPGPNVIDSVAMSPDRTTVWYSECCEPVGGALYRVPVDGSAAPTWVSHGYDPVLSASGRWVASVSIYGVVVLDLEGGPARQWWNEGDAGEHQEVAWSPDGERLAVRTGTPLQGMLELVDPAELEPVADGAVPDGSGSRLIIRGTWRRPAFARDGRILAAEWSDSTWRPRLVDPATGASEAAPFEYELPIPLDHDYDATGEWLLVLEGTEASGAGSARWVGPDGTTSTWITGTYRAVSW